MASCFYCGKEIKKGTGLLYVSNKGQMMNFCSSRCKKYNKMGRKKGKWAEKPEE
ncbi:MAG: 50S ribosomal protein L24e [Candidatus Aenigmatarchaeota archaeon]